MPSTVKIYSFPKQEKLCGQIRIKKLYETGKRLSCFPLRVCFRYSRSEEPRIEVLVWATKSLFKRANRRNRLKRLMREAFRLNKQPLQDRLQQKGLSLQVAYNYIHTEEIPLRKIEEAMRKSIKKMLEAEIESDIEEQE